ncbi:MAG: Uracil phosphoribosyltransferase [candidate division TA06 bacterium 32_111]|uniref:Uracil phosphoribosyltransferase n=2 Tax=Bacteria candidate phyla TaxID=1783234 RepID=A0A101I021_UNCT6|nr:MAG: Uracil phosphoribosyltransferase [candidate division TA06 bacterium 32_111]KUK86552.1 MAG: Uracil phosphoribosyltransferase [candidate division TA06 bacterium 34_109]HAF07901.1 uracil phosphoribosyltransferase [candidate division WOR-3 bacterium]HCP16397.1 uracil phosphoribosyltransferase [candidate division WOR-3 bacterium]
MTVHEIKHPLALEKLAILRDKKTGSDIFSKNLEELSLILFLEATKNLTTKKLKVETPFKEIEGDFIKKEILLVPILRAGIGMIPLIRKFYPKTHVGMIGLKRDEHILKPITYYVNLPKNLENYSVFILDPMLATGGSIIKTLEILAGYNVKPDAVISIISAPEGIKSVMESVKNIDIFTVAVDEKLNENGYIVPGLGDAGDRFFNTEE